MYKYKNIEHALIELAKKAKDAPEIEVRGMKTKELLLEPFIIENVTQLTTFNKIRNANVFAQVAEALWVLAGSSDLDWLETYIPQCKKWSDDGKVWRAGYGPRLRAWEGFEGQEAMPYSVDQIAEVIEKLKGDIHTRQAVITIWDPAQDWIEGSKDYPCNNWLHFIVRDGLLYMNVGVRSNDLIYGFSHVDFFLWAFLQRYIAQQLGIDTGSMLWNATSMHVYTRHYSMIEEIANSALNPTFLPTDSSELYITKTDQEYVEAIRSMMVGQSYRSFKHDDLIGHMFKILSIYDIYLEYQNDDIDMLERVKLAKLLAGALNSLPTTDISSAAIRWISNKIPGIDAYFHLY